MKNYKTRASAIENVKQFFSHSKEDAISLEEAASAWGRDPTKTEENKAWISNLLTHLKYHSLVKPIYSRKNRRRVLSKIQLTYEGKKVLGRVSLDALGVNPNELSFSQERVISRPPTLEDVGKVVAEYKKHNEDFEVTFTVKLKTEGNGG